MEEIWPNAKLGAGFGLFLSAAIGAFCVVGCIPILGFTIPGALLAGVVIALPAIKICKAFIKAPTRPLAFFAGAAITTAALTIPLVATMKVTQQLIHYDFSNPGRTTSSFNAYAWPSHKKSAEEKPAVVQQNRHRPGY